MCVRFLIISFFRKILHVQPIPLWAYGDQYKYLQVKPEVNAEAGKGEEVEPEWLYGPASYWYIKNEHLIENGKFNYGFKEKTVCIISLPLQLRNYEILDFFVQANFIF